MKCFTTSLALTSELSENNFKRASRKLLQIITKLSFAIMCLVGIEHFWTCYVSVVISKKVKNKIYKSWENIYGTKDLKQKECRHISALLSANCISFHFSMTRFLASDVQRGEKYFFCKIYKLNIDFQLSHRPVTCRAK